MTKHGEVEDALRVLMKLEELSGNEKVSLLVENAGNHVLQTLLVYTLSPYEIFHVGEKMVPNAPTSRVSDLQFNYASFVGLLAALKSWALSGNAAKDAMREFLSRCTPLEQTIYRRVLLKDLRVGVQTKTVNKVWPNLVPTFDLMLAQPFDEARLELPLYAEPKLDGIRAVVIVGEDGKANMFSRGGHALQNFQHIIEEVEALFCAGMVVDGELTCSQKLQETQTQIFRKYGVDTSKYRLTVFDVLTFSEFSGFDSTPYVQRLQVRREYKRYAHKAKHLKFVPVKYCESPEEVFDIYVHSRKQGYEGLILKDPSAPYVQKRSYAWMKVKPADFGDCVDVDVPVVGYEMGKGRLSHTLGKFIVSYNGVKVGVGTGLSDIQRDEFLKMLQAKEPLIIRVVAQCETADGSLRDPRFICDRPDLVDNK